MNSQHKISHISTVYCTSVLGYCICCINYLSEVRNLTFAKFSDNIHTFSCGQRYLRRKNTTLSSKKLTLKTISVGSGDKEVSLPSNECCCTGSVTFYGNHFVFLARSILFAYVTHAWKEDKKNGSSSCPLVLLLSLHLPAEKNSVSVWELAEAVVLD